MRHDALRYTLANDPVLTEAIADFERRTLPPTSDTLLTGRVLRAPGVVVQAFTHAVIDTPQDRASASAAPATAPALLLFHKQSASRQVRVFRINSLTGRFLDQCDGRHTIQEAARLVAAPERGNPDDCVQLGLTLASRRVIGVMRVRRTYRTRGNRLPVLSSSNNTMCGIVGIIGTDRSPYPSLVSAMSRALRHRGPDSEGSHATRIAEVGMRRLSIVDLREGDQPIFNETGDLAVVFNGEIYNYQELRVWLEQRGHRFRTHTDTEVIVHLFEEEGADCVHRLHGMFAFAIVGDDQVFLARDRLGIKPLFITTVREGRLLLFASELKALLCCADVI